MEEQDIRNALQAMKENSNLETNPSFRANSEKWPGNEISFIDNHLEYLRQHPKTDPRHYLSNLRLQLRKTTRI